MVQECPLGVGHCRLRFPASQAAVITGPGSRGRCRGSLVATTMIGAVCRRIVRCHGSTPCSLVSGFCLRGLEDGMPRPAQAVDEEVHRQPSQDPAASGLRLAAAGPNIPRRRHRLVRRLQPHIARRRQPSARYPVGDHEPHTRLRPCLHQPRPRGEEEPQTANDPLPVAG